MQVGFTPNKTICSVTTSISPSLRCASVRSPESRRLFLELHQALCPFSSRLEPHILPLQSLDLSARGFFSLREGPLFFCASPSNSPLPRCLRQAVRIEEYSPSRPRRAPTSPTWVQASASLKILSLYYAIYRHRVGFAVTSTSEMPNDIIFVVPMINSFPALYIKLRERKCLIHIL